MPGRWPRRGHSIDEMPCHQTDVGARQDDRLAHGEKTQHLRRKTVVIEWIAGSWLHYMSAMARMSARRRDQPRNPYPSKTRASTDGIPVVGRSSRTDTDQLAGMPRRLSKATARYRLRTSRSWRLHVAVVGEHAASELMPSSARRRRCGAANENGCVGAGQKTTRDVPGFSRPMKRLAAKSHWLAMNWRLRRDATVHWELARKRAALGLGRSAADRPCSGDVLLVVL